MYWTSSWLLFIIYSMLHVPRIPWWIPWWIHLGNHCECKCMAQAEILESVFNLANQIYVFLLATFYPYKCHDSTHTFDGNHGNNIIVHNYAFGANRHDATSPISDLQTSPYSSRSIWVVHWVLHCMHSIPNTSSTSNVEAAIVTVTHHNMYIGPIKSL